mgnify:FL=1
MYEADAREKLISNSRIISELSAELELRGDNPALRSRIDALASEQEQLTDGLFGRGAIRYGVLHRTCFQTE